MNKPIKIYTLILLIAYLIISITAQGGIPTVEPPPSDTATHVPTLTHTTTTTHTTQAPTITHQQNKPQQIIQQNKVTVDAKTMEVILQPQTATHQPTPTTDTLTVTVTDAPTAAATDTTAGTSTVKRTQQLPNIQIQNPESVTFQGVDDFGKNMDPLQQTVIQNQQTQAQQQQRQRQQKQVHPWIAAELQTLNQANQVKTHQIFSFEIDKQIQFKWNPSQFKSGPLKFVVQVFDFNRGDIFFPSNPQQDDYIDVYAQPDSSTMFLNLGKVYMKKVFTINFFSDFQMLRFKNQYDQRMFIQISLQATKFVPEKALDDDDLKIPSQKIKSILQELEQTQKKRQKSYKQQWSFRDRQEHHQSQMLILTGLELLVIIGTAFVQIYCIKNLFDNRLIV